MLVAVIGVVVFAWSNGFGGNGQWFGAFWNQISPPDTLALASIGESPTKNSAPIPAKPIGAIAFKQNSWVDSVYESLTPQQRLGQLFMLAAYSTRNSDTTELARLIRTYNIGGLCFFKGTPSRQVELTNFYQSVAKTPMLISMDAEWGPSMRLDSTLQYPYQMTLGAGGDLMGTEAMGKASATELKRLGVHISFSPVVDVNSNPLNPVIAFRSFGEQPKRVADLGKAYMRGLQQEGIIAVGKHFPGHGDTDADSHEELPTVGAPFSRLDTLELQPFRELIDAGVGGMMVGHLRVPVLDEAGTPASLSRPIVSKLLKKDMDFRNLVFTDALNMKGVSVGREPGQVELEALKAGNDVLLFSVHVPEAIAAIEAALAEGSLSDKEVERAVRKIIAAKYFAQLHKYEPTQVALVANDLNPPGGELLLHRLYQSGITAVRNEVGLLPLTTHDTSRVLSIEFGNALSTNEFTKMMRRMGPHESYFAGYHDTLDYDTVRKMVRSGAFGRVVITLHDVTSSRKKGYGLTPEAIAFVKELSVMRQTALVVLGSPYCLAEFPGMNSVVVAYQDLPYTREAAAQAIWGAIPMTGKLPVSPSAEYRAGQGRQVAANGRLAYAIPEEMGLSSALLGEIDLLAQEAVNFRATPGCQIVVVKDGKIVYEKAFGNLSYEGGALSTETLYDIASVTKVASTALAMMKLSSEGRLDVYKTLNTYLPETKKTNKGGLRLHDIMTHQAGLQPMVRFYERTMKSGQPCMDYYCDVPSNAYAVQVAPRMYLKTGYPEYMWRHILQTPVGDTGRYAYSDLGSILLQHVAEKLVGMPLDKYVSREFYRPMGLQSIGYQPLLIFDQSQIAPTELDQNFRKQLIQGTVHDEMAAIFGGIAGHAGLFSNAHDVAAIFQMLLNGGNYGGKNYLSPNIIQQYTSRQTNTAHRGLTFDKPSGVHGGGVGGNTAPQVSTQTFGHTGFTGTCVWADPTNGLVYVFLSNRVNPTRDNTLLLKNNYRTRIHEAIYKAFVSPPLLNASGTAN